MAKFNSTTFGAISGRHGSAVAATTKDGQSYLRVYRAPSDPKTDKQVAQRSKFAFANSSLGCFRNLFKETFNSNRGINIGVSYALRDAISGEAPNFTLDYSKILFSVGNVNQALSASAVVTADTTVSITWDMVEATLSKSDDKMSFIFFDEATQLSIHLKDRSIRSTGSESIQLPAVWKNSKVYCWMYISTSDNLQNTNHSTSQFVAELQL